MHEVSSSSGVNVSSINCLLCQKRFQTDLALQRHYYITKHQPTNYNPNDDPSTSNASCTKEIDMLTCPECNRTFDTIHLLTLHMTALRHKYPICKVCNHWFNDHKSFANHQHSTGHTNPLPFESSRYFPFDRPLHEHNYGTCSIDVFRQLIAAARTANVEEFIKIHESNKNSINLNGYIAEEVGGTRNVPLIGLVKSDVETTDQAIAIVRYMLLHGVDINATCVVGESFLASACSSNNLELARFLLCHGADPNLPSWAKQPARVTALGYATNRKNIEVMKLLLDYGADISVTAFGDPLLHLAVKHFKADHQGNQALTFQIIDLLLSRGARKTERNSRGETLVQLAESYGHHELIPYLK